MNKSYSYKPSPEEEEEFEREEKEAVSSSLGGTPFNVLMQQAGKMKSKQGEVFRKKYDSYPLWYQHSMFSNEEVLEARTLEYEERMKAAVVMKSRGNKSLQDGELYDAMHDYERALAVFNWIENLKEDWKRKEIEDEFIVQHEYNPENDTQSKEVVEFQCSCLLNLALVYSHQLQWSDVIRACTAVLEKDPKNSKAYFRRAQARYRPMYCGATENEVALKDLKQALSLKPEDKLIRREYVKLKRELEKQHVKDSKQFGGLFDRGRVVEDAGNADMSSIHDESQSRMTVEEALQSLKDAESTCQRYYEDGRFEDAARLRGTVDKLRKDIDDFRTEQREKVEKESSARNPFLDIDLSNITPEQLEDAKKSGLDLQDPKVRGYIADIQKELRLDEMREHSHLKKKRRGPNDGDKMKAIMDRIESRKLVDILSKDWDKEENNELVSQLLSNRLMYSEQNEMPEIRVEEIDNEDEDSGDDKFRDEKVMEYDTEYESLYEHMVEDVSILYDNEIARMSQESSKHQADTFSDRIMNMMEEKYKLRSVEKELREKQGLDWRSIIIYTVFGFLLFRFFIVPNYNRFCLSYCSEKDCTDSVLCNPIREHFSAEDTVSDNGSMDNYFDSEF